jgi:hypothetical protein
MENLLPHFQMAVTAAVQILGGVTMRYSVTNFSGIVENAAFWKRIKVR